jgi:hypothetical protein
MCLAILENGTETHSIDWIGNIRFVEKDNQKFIVWDWNGWYNYDDNYFSFEIDSVPCYIGCNTFIDDDPGVHRYTSKLDVTYTILEDSALPDVTIVGDDQAFCSSTDPLADYVGGTSFSYINTNLWWRI